MKVLVVEDQVRFGEMLCRAIDSLGYSSDFVTAGAEALKIAEANAYDMAFIDLHLEAESGIDLIRRFLAINRQMKIVLMTAHATVGSAVEAMREGAWDYLSKPFTPAQLESILRFAEETRSLEDTMSALRQAGQTHSSPLSMSSNNPVMGHVIELARKIALSDATVFLCGESGTGKNHLARLIHLSSDRAAFPFATVSCPTLSGSLLESELFGHVRGAFTGALRSAPGRIAACEGGTLFLDEIGDLPLEIQPKLLRFLQERTYERVGDSVTQHANVRLITATNIDLAEAVRNRRFREDLLYRINVVQIELPPLRDRREDIPDLAMQILAQVSNRQALVGFSEEAMRVLQNHDWPGNIRDLRNAIHRASILSKGTRIGVQHLPDFSRRTKSPSLGDPVPSDEIEAIHLRRLIAGTQSIRKTAEVLGIDAATLWRKRKKFGL